eukprot:gene4834-5466_t
MAAENQQTPEGPVLNARLESLENSLANIHETLRSLLAPNNEASGSAASGMFSSSEQLESQAAIPVAPSFLRVQNSNPTIPTPSLLNPPTSGPSPTAAPTWLENITGLPAEECSNEIENELIRIRSQLKQKDQEIIGELNLFDKIEGWLAIPNRQNIKKYGWKKQYVVVSSRKVFFYNNEGDKQASTPSMILDISKLFHVRSVTQGDVIRADAKDIPKIFQILYANEGEARNPEEKEEQQQNEEKGLAIDYLGHQFYVMHYHMPTNCEVCPKPLWNMFKPPTALECRRCHIKCHKDHVDREEDCISTCKVDLTTAKELLVLATTPEEQKQWVTSLSHKIVRKDPQQKKNSSKNRLASPGNITKSQSAVNDVIRNSADRAPHRSQSVTATHHHNSKRD